MAFDYGPECRSCKKPKNKADNLCPHCGKLQDPSNNPYEGGLVIMAAISLFAAWVWEKLTGGTKKK